MDHAIDVHDLRRSYGDFEAVRGISFTVAAGEVFCLLGPNGAGKTTATEILEGYRRRSAGTVSVLGFDPQDGERAFRERVGIVLQETGVQDELTVTEVLRMYARYYPRPRPAAELIELVGLDAKASARVKSLSGGQRRRLDLALALVGRPQLLFLDEPTTGFDPSARRQAWEAIRALRAEGTTVVLTTHFMDEAQALADRIAVMVGGRLVAEGTPAELGGRDEAPTEIRFVLPAGLTLGDLPALPAAEVTADDAGRVLIRSTEGIRATHALTAWALDWGVALDDFAVAQPTLEDVYLQLTRDPDPIPA